MNALELFFHGVWLVWLVWSNLACFAAFTPLSSSVPCFCRRSCRTNVVRPSVIPLLFRPFAGLSPSCLLCLLACSLAVSSVCWLVPWLFPPCCCFLRLLPCTLAVSPACWLVPLRCPPFAGLFHGWLVGWFVGQFAFLHILDLMFLHT